MPQAPIIVPIIIAGVTLGSLLASQKRTLSKKRLGGLSLLSGILNFVNAFLVYQIIPPPTFSQTGGTQFGQTGATQFSQFRAAASAGSMYTFFVSSFLVGVLVPLAIIGIALLYARHKAGKPSEEEPNLEDEEPDLEDEENKA